MARHPNPPLKIRQLGRPTGQTNRTDQLGSLGRPQGQTGQTTWTDQQDRPVEQTNWADLPFLDKKTFDSRVALFKSKNYRRLAQHFLRIGKREFFTAYNELSDELGIPFSTVRKAFDALKDQGIIQSRYDYNRERRVQGQVVLFLGPANEKEVEGADQQDRPTGQTGISSKIDRFEEGIKNLSIKDLLSKWDDNYLKLMFPNLFAIPFTADNLRSAITARENAGKTLDHIPLWMEWMEFDAERGSFKDGKGAAVGSGYVFRILTLKGYGRPEGWFDPDQKMQEDEMARLKDLEKLRKELAERYKEDWLARLKPSDKEKLIHLGRNNGKDKFIPEQIALESVFRKYQNEIIETMKADPFKAYPDHLIT